VLPAGRFFQIRSKDVFPRRSALRRNSSVHYLSRCCHFLKGRFLSIWIRETLRKALQVANISGPMDIPGKRRRALGQENYGTTIERANRSMKCSSRREFPQGRLRSGNRKNGRYSAVSRDPGAERRIQRSRCPSGAARRGLRPLKCRRRAKSFVKRGRRLAHREPTEQQGFGRSTDGRGRGHNRGRHRRQWTRRYTCDPISRISRSVRA